MRKKSLGKNKSQFYMYPCCCWNSNLRGFLLLSCTLGLQLKIKYMCGSLYLKGTTGTMCGTVREVNVPGETGFSP